VKLACVLPTHFGFESDSALIREGACLLCSILRRRETLRSRSLGESEFTPGNAQILFSGFSLGAPRPGNAHESFSGISLGSHRFNRRSAMRSRRVLFDEDARNRQTFLFGPAAHRSVCQPRR
jgi:hypothetical protein